MSRPLWFVRLVKKIFPGRFLVARLTRVPVLGKMIERWLFEGDALIYLPRERVIHVGRSLEPPQEMVLPSQVVEHFIGPAGC